MGRPTDVFNQQSNMIVNPTNLNSVAGGLSNDSEQQPHLDSRTPTYGKTDRFSQREKNAQKMETEMSCCGSFLDSLGLKFRRNKRKNKNKDSLKIVSSLASPRWIERR